MKLKRKIIILLVLVLLLVVASYILPAQGNLNRYSKYVFYPFQSFRGMLFSRLPFSIGDILYVMAGIWLLTTLVKWVWFVAKLRLYKERLVSSILSTVNTILFAYLFFILGWGANYYKHPLREYWGLYGSANDSLKLSKNELKIKIKKDLVTFDSFLVGKLNAYAPHYQSLSFKEINERARSYYTSYTDTKLKSYGLGVKPTLFGYFMERLAIEGYYNPFTGEGQIDDGLPRFVMPFLLCHEFAHQAGIAAEGDANLMAYAICTTTDDSIFRYSSYLDIWLYTNNRLYWRDSVTAKKFESQLNKLTTAHIDTLEQLSQKYHNEFARYSSELYDSYLKMQDQKEGIRSYGNVASSAWLLEQRRTPGEKKIISIPR